MKSARALAQAAVTSIALLALSSSAHAELLQGTWYGVGSTVNPATGPVTNTVVGHRRERLIYVAWQCGRTPYCYEAGEQMELGSRGQVMLAPTDTANLRRWGVAMPGRFFLLEPNSDCIARYGPDARAGAWLTETGVPVVQQCFSKTRYLTVRPRPGLPPIRFAPTALPRQLLERGGAE
jgi:hypothetical protein